MTTNEISMQLRVARRWPWGTIFGFAVVGLYIAFTTIAIARYPEVVSPLDTYLSPQGAIFYNLAVILAGLVELPFFIAIYVFYSPYSRKGLLLIGLLAGMTNGLAVFMTGVNPLNLTGDIRAHVTWSYIIFFSLIPVLVAFGLALWRVKGVSRYIGLYGFAACTIDIFFLAALLSGHSGAGLGSSMEWFSVLSYIVWIAFISLDVLVKTRAESRRRVGKVLFR